MAHIDISLETILRSGRSRLPDLLEFPGDHIPVAADIRTIWGDKVGYLTSVDQTRKRASLVQIELQATRDPNMTTWMLTFLSAIRNWAITQRQFEGTRLRQTVVYVGSKPWKPKTEIKDLGLYYSHGFVDARDIDPEPLLNSDNLGDVAFAVLCRDGARSGLRKALDRIVAAPFPSRTDALATLGRLADLRGIGDRVRSELAKTGVVVN
ncbi:hypothetical protein [Bradyrhizobium sp. 23AC]